MASSGTRNLTHTPRAATARLAVLFGAVALAACQTEPPPLTADVPLHLEQHLDQAVVSSSEAADDIPEPVEWRFDEPQPAWRALIPAAPEVKPASLSRTEDALRIALTETSPYGGVYIPLPDWRREDWGEVLVRARTSDEVNGIILGFNLQREEGARAAWPRNLFEFFGAHLPVIRDGSEQTYVMRADWSIDHWQQWEGPWRELGIGVRSRKPAEFDILSVSVIPKETRFMAASTGVRTEVRNEAYRKVLYVHAPSRIEYRVNVPQAGRLDVGLGALRDDAPIKFSITAQLDGSTAERLFEETYGDSERWGQRSVSLAHLAGQTINLSLEATGQRPGSVALWAAPTLSGARSTSKPNVIFYIIDGAGSEYMSVYGYNRRTTPNIERLAAEGVLFENAWSNSSWTRPSTLSFLTGLQHSALGGLKNGRNVPPKEVPTIQERLHSVGYQTALLTSNPNAGTMSNLDRGTDWLREHGLEPTSHSTKELHADFWKWRDEYPGEPYWVHLQTTDVHHPHDPPDPFAGLYVSPERREILAQWEARLSQAARDWPDPWGEAFESSGVDRVAFYNGQRDLYAEAMAHQDHQLGRLVERLKDRGEWDHTLLIIAADHGADMGALHDYALATRERLPPKWGPLLRRKIPMIFVWPGHIRPGVRIRDAVSMVDMAPTILELLGLPPPELTHGQSLAPLLTGQGEWHPRPVVFDEFDVDATTEELRGLIDVVDGRWRASLKVGKSGGGGRPADLLLYDLWSDPECFNSVHEEHPEVVRKYSEFLHAQLEEHRWTFSQLTRGEDSPLGSEQLQTSGRLGTFSDSWPERPPIRA